MSAQFDENAIRALRIRNASDAELDTIKSLLTTWLRRLDKNLRRTVYADGEQVFKDLGISMPPQLRKAKFYLGWATKAVKVPAQRVQFDGFRLPGSRDPFDLGELMQANNFALEFSQGVQAAGTHGASLVTLGVGGSGEPPVQIQGHELTYASAIWDRRNRRVASALTIQELDEREPTSFIVYLPNATLVCEKGARGWAVTQRIANPLGRPAVVAVPNDPKIRQPFGRSRITNPVMALTDQAVRAHVRMEGNAEFYSTPQLAALGVDEESFANVSDAKKFQLAMDRLLTLTRDEEGRAPDLQQLQQASMAPHTGMLQQIASTFRAETGLSESSLGVAHDNPTNADAIRAAEHELLIDVTYQMKMVLAPRAQEIATLAVMLRDGLTEPPEDAWRLSTKFADPEFRSLSAKADAAVKLASGFPNLATSDVLLEELFDEDQMDRIRAERRRASAGSLMERLAAGGPASASEEESATTTEE